MYALLKSVDTYWAYLAFLILVIAIINSVKGVFTKQKSFENHDLRIALFGLIFSHIQLFISLLLYFISPWFQQWSNLGIDVFTDSQSRLYLVEHPLMNILAILLIRMGWSMHKRQTEASKKFLRIAIFYGLGVIFLLIITPR